MNKMTMTPHKATSHKSKPRTSERGNVFFFILLGVVLFATLSYTIARGLQSNTSRNMGQRKVTLIATDLLLYAQKMTRATERIRRQGISETDISFEDYNAAYANANCTTDNCHIFRASGGSMNMIALPKGADWFDSGWEFHNGHEIDGIGTTCGAATCSDLIMTVHFTNQELCTYINKDLGIANVSGALPSVPNITGAPHTGTFAYTNTVGNVPASAPISGATSACVQETAGCEGTASNSCYTFYHVLLAR